MHLWTFRWRRDLHAMRIVRTEGLRQVSSSLAHAPVTELGDVEWDCALGRVKRMREASRQAHAKLTPSAN